jgi:two-component system, cell cycle sensor histidine kinase and response regulator CckA
MKAPLPNNEAARLETLYQYEIFDSETESGFDEIVRLAAYICARQQETSREQLVGEIAQGIRKSLKLEEILSTTVSEVWEFLQADRVFIYRFKPDWSGVVVTESVNSDYLPILGKEIKDSFFEQNYGWQLYQKGRIQATEDIYTAGLSKCHIDLLTKLQIRANLVVPILQEQGLWGLLVVNQCDSPRQWQPLDINLLSNLAMQVAIAIQQSTLFEQVQTELIERKQAEQKILEQAALLDVATDAIFVQDMENHILFWNKGAENLYCWLAKEVNGKKVNRLLYKGLRLTNENLHIVIKEGKWSGELHQVTKLGQKIIVFSRWTLLLDEIGQPKSILVVNTDITEKKLFEAQFLRSQRLESIGTLASGIAHDLNNALAPVLMIAELLQEKNSDPQSQMLLVELKNSAKRGANLDISTCGQI